VATPWTTKLREQRVLIDSDGVKLKQKVKLYLTTDEKMWLKNNVEKEGGGCLHTLPEAKRLLKLGHRLRKVQALYIIIIINIYIFNTNHMFQDGSALVSQTFWFPTGVDGGNGGIL